MTATARRVRPCRLAGGVPWATLTATTASAPTLTVGLALSTVRLATCLGRTTTCTLFDGRIVLTGLALALGEIGAKPRNTRVYVPGGVWGPTVSTAGTSSLPAVKLRAAKVMPGAISGGTGVTW